MEPVDAAQQLPEPIEEEEIFMTGEEEDTSTTVWKFLFFDFLINEISKFMIWFHFI